MMFHRAALLALGIIGPVLEMMPNNNIEKEKLLSHLRSVILILLNDLLTIMLLMATLNNTK